MLLSVVLAEHEYLAFGCELPKQRDEQIKATGIGRATDCAEPHGQRGGSVGPALGK